jgi:hypothetical protein
VTRRNYPTCTQLHDLLDRRVLNGAAFSKNAVSKKTTRSTDPGAGRRMHPRQIGDNRHPNRRSSKRLTPEGASGPVANRRLEIGMAADNLAYEPLAGCLLHQAAGV